MIHCTRSRRCRPVGGSVAVASDPRRRAVRERFREAGRRHRDVVGDALQLERRGGPPTSRRAQGSGRVPPPGAVPPAAQDKVAAVERGPGRRLAVDGHELDPVAGRSATGGRTRHVARTHGRVEAVRLEAGAGDGDVEPELVEDSGRRARADVAAERPVDVEVDRL